MTRCVLLGVVWCAAAGWATVHVEAGRPAAALQARAGQSVDPVTNVSRVYCAGCHNDRLKSGGLSLDGLTPDRDAETWEKVVRKVRAGLMPPAGAKRPDRAALATKIWATRACASSSTISVARIASATISAAPP